MQSVSDSEPLNHNIYQHYIVAHYYSHHTQVNNSLTAVLNQIFNEKYVSQ